MKGAASILMVGQSQQVRRIGLQTCHGGLDDLDQALVEQANAGCGGATPWAERKVGGCAGHAQGLQAIPAVSAWHRARNVVHRLRRLADGDGGDHRVCGRVDRVHRILVLKTHVNAGPVAGRPNAMWKMADGYGRNLREVVPSEDLHLVQAAYGDVGELAAIGVDEIDMIGDRARVDHRQGVEWRERVDHDGLASVFLRIPDLRTVGRGSDVGQNGLIEERARLRCGSSRRRQRSRD